MTPKKGASKRSKTPETTTSAQGDEAAGDVSRTVAAPLPRPPRTRPKASIDRGLAEPAELSKLAEAYLEQQVRHFPAMVGSDLLPLPSAETLTAMVEDFQRRHRGEAVDALRLKNQLTAANIKLVGGAYCRYSCDNSNPTSIVDQLAKILTKAAAEGRFVPWCYVFADYSVTGLDSSRRGYSSYKTMLSTAGQWIETTYIDDFTRASRDEIEWWKLALLSKRLKKRMVGASDGFNLDSGDWDVHLTIYGLVSRLMIRSIKQKVARGMQGAARRGTCLGKPPFGFTRCPKLDADGHPVVGGDGLPLHEVCHDPATVDHLRRMFELYTTQNWSITKIRDEFNQLQIDDWNGWSYPVIRSMLHNPAAIGVFIWSKFRHEFDPETNRTTKVKNPRSAWLVNYKPELAVIPLEQWRAAKRKLAATRRQSQLAGRTPSRNQMSPSTLFSGTLYCACCNSELKLARSSKDCKQLGSTHGVLGAHGCRLSSSKSVKVIEDCLLGYLRDQLLTDEVVEELVNRANAVLDVEAARPLPDIAPLERQANDLRKKIDRLVKRSAATDDDRTAAAYELEIKRLSNDLVLVSAQLRDLQAARQRTIERLDVEQARQLLADLRSVLRAEIAVAGPAIRALTGPIHVREEAIPGRKKRTRWIASFRPQLPQLLQSVCPTDCGRWAAAQLGEAPPVEVVIEPVPLYVRFAPEFAALRAQGRTLEQIAKAYGVTAPRVSAALRYNAVGTLPDANRTRRPRSGQPFVPKYKQIAAEVARRHDLEHETFGKIARELKVHYRTVVNAYEFAHPETVQRPCRSVDGLTEYAAQLPPQAMATVLEMRARGATVLEMSAAIGCGAEAVEREVRRLELLEQRAAAAT